MAQIGVEPKVLCNKTALPAVIIFNLVDIWIILKILTTTFADKPILAIEEHCSSRLLLFKKKSKSNEKS